jgi:hypothetical protein
LFFGLRVIYVTRSLVIICKTPPKRSFNIIIVLLFNIIRIVSFVDKSRDLLHATLGGDNRSFVREDHLPPLCKPLILPRKGNLVSLGLLDIC